MAAERLRVQERVSYGREGGIVAPSGKLLPSRWVSYGRGWNIADRSGVGTLWIHGYACIQCGGVGVRLRILRAFLCDSTMFAYRFVVKNARNAHSGFYFE